MLDDAQLIKYIDYFSDDKIEFCKWTTPEQQEDGVIVMGYPSYDEGVSRFIDDFYKSDLIDGGYLESLERYGTKASTPAELIVTADIDLLKAILTYYVRQERFCDGAWAEAIEEKVFLKILLRLKELRRL
jgi:hypothetical protein